MRKARPLAESHPIHGIFIFLLWSCSEKRQAALTEIDHLVSNTIIIDDTKDCADEAEKYQGHVTRADGQVGKQYIEPVSSASAYTVCRLVISRSTYTGIHRDIDSNSDNTQSEG